MTQNQIVDQFNGAVASAEENRRRRVREDYEKLPPAERKRLKIKSALRNMGELPGLTGEELEIIRSSPFVACRVCNQIFPHDRQPVQWFERDQCPRCQTMLWGCIRGRAQPDRLDNPYFFDVVRLFKGTAPIEGERMERSLASSVITMSARELLTDKYAWAIPDEQAINLIAQFGPILEIGAGRGYWAWLLSQKGVAVDAFDVKPPPNFYHDNGDHTFYPVKKGGPSVAALPKYKDHSLFLCWPPYSSNMADRCIRGFRGRHVIYVGERGGCTGDERFNRRIDEEWEMIADSDIPQWGGIHDYVMVYRRKK